MKTKTKELVSLRQRPTRNGGQSLYLDFTVDGVRTRKFLKMYLVPEKTKVDKIQNQETLKAAAAIKARRTVMLQDNKAGIKPRGADKPLGDYINELAESYRSRGKTAHSQTLDKIRRWLNDYGARATLRTVDRDYLLGFVRFMRKGKRVFRKKPGGEKVRRLSEGTICLYFTNLNTVFNKACREGLMDVNPISRMDPGEKPRMPESNREYLTLEEVKTLAAARCGNEQVRRAFLFSCFTGLRLGDIESLTWEKIKDTGNGLQIEATQTKTGKAVYVPLPPNAVSQLPGRSGGKVFRLPARGTTGEILRNWVKRAGIGKHISFHCARHTYATLLLNYGADIYTVSKLLGHTNVSTTQIYADIMDEKKRETVSLIPDIGES